MVFLGAFPMILLTAVRVDIRGSCRFRIEADGTDQVTSDPVKAARILFHLGVPEPLQLVDHARQWGSVEIVEHSSSPH
jgi:hypothetical protein